MNKLLFPPFIKDKGGELTMTLCLIALVKRVAELREVGLSANSPPRPSGEAGF
jgi:hypothetical protein